MSITAGMVEQVKGSAGDGFDWGAETALGFEPGPGELVDGRAARVALLTGATGFLGGFLLRELLEQTDLRVVCLVRGRDAETARARLEGSPAAGTGWGPEFRDRVEVVTGDLGRPDLGLGAAGFRELARRVDVVYHNAAQINLAHRYGRLRGPNVEGTRAMLRLALAGGRWKPLHYVSSIGVVTSRPFVECQVAAEQDVPCELDTLKGGYPQSKAVAESLVRQAGALGLPVTIYRPGLLIGCSATGVWSTDDLLSNLLRAWVHCGSAFELDGRLDLTPVDYVSRALVHLSRRPEAEGRTFHLVNPEPPTIPELAGVFTRAGFPVQMVGLDAWREVLDRRSAELCDSRLAATLLLFPSGATRHDHQALVPLVYRIRFDDAQARGLLEPAGIRCPVVDAPLVRRYIGFLEGTRQL